MKNTTHQYRHTLKEIFVSIQERNPTYSQNSFAKYLGVTTSYYSKMMNGKIGLSLNIADKITKKLRMEPDERKAFIFSVAEEQHWHSLALIDESFKRPETSQLHTN